MTTIIFPIFNPADFQNPTQINSLIAENIQSSNISSTVVSLLDLSGNVSQAITQNDLTNAINQITGGTLNTSLQTLLQIDQAINNDPNFYTDVTTSINNVQTNVNTLTSQVNTISSKQATDETNITTLQNTKLNVSNPNYSGTCYGSNLNLTGTFSTSGNINVLGISISPSQISYLGNDSSDIQNQINGKASTNSPIFTGTLTSASIVDNGTLICNGGLNCASGNVYFPNNSISQNSINGLSTNFPTLSGNNNFLGTNSFNIIDISGNIIVNNKTITPTTLSLLYDLSGSSVQSQINSLNTNIGSLQSNTNGLTCVSGTTSLSNNLNCKSISDNGLFSCSGNATIGTNSSNSLIVNSTSSFLSTASFNQIDLSGNILANGLSISPYKIGYLSNVNSDIQNQITTNANNITTNTNNIATNTTNISNNTNSITSINTTLSGKQNPLTFDSSPTLNSTNIVNSNGIYNALQNYELTSNLTSTLSSYATNSSLSNYATTSSLSSYAPINNSSLTGITTVNEVSELIYNGGSGSSLSISYNSVKGIIYFTPSQNFSLALTNVPTSSNLATYSLTFIYNAKFYCNSISVNSTSYTMDAGGVSNISINSSASYVIQQISIIFLNSSTPIVITNVLSLF